MSTLKLSKSTSPKSSSHQPLRGRNRNNHVAQPTTSKPAGKKPQVRTAPSTARSHSSDRTLATGPSNQTGHAGNRDAHRSEQRSYGDRSQRSDGNPRSGERHSQRADGASRFSSDRNARPSTTRSEERRSPREDRPYAKRTDAHRPSRGDRPYTKHTDDRKSRQSDRPARDAFSQTRHASRDDRFADRRRNEGEHSSYHPNRGEHRREDRPYTSRESKRADSRGERGGYQGNRAGSDRPKSSDSRFDQRPRSDFSSGDGQQRPYRDRADNSSLSASPSGRSQRKPADAGHRDGSFAQRPQREPQRHGKVRDTFMSRNDHHNSKSIVSKSTNEHRVARPQHVSPQIDSADGIRLSKHMADQGMCSRREADQYIEKGWVTVNGQRASLGQRVLPTDKIQVARQAQNAQASRVTILVNKPVGLVSGQAEDGYLPAASLISPENHWAQDDSGIRFEHLHLRGLAPAGRLDIDSVGLLVLTQDGRVAKTLIGEDSTVDKEYLVRVEGELSDEGLKLLNHGLQLDGVDLRPAKVSWQNEDQLRFVLREGKKRQIRRMCELMGLHVVGLKRIRIGKVKLGDLPTGQWRYLNADESFE